MHAIALAGPAVEPVPLADMKTYLRIDQEAEDDLVASLVAAARGTVEGATRLALVAQTWRVTLPVLLRPGRVPLPLWPVLSVEAVRLLGAAGTVELAPEAYRLDASGDPAILSIAPDAVPPDAALGAVAVDLTAGFGPAAADVPPSLRLAVRRLAARWYAERGDEARPGAGPLDPDIAALVAPFRRPRLA